MLKTIKAERGEPKVKATLAFLLNGDQILLAMKKRGFGEGKWNGIGGKVEENETIEQAIIREAFEEITVQPVKPSHTATINFYFSHRTDWDQQVHVFRIGQWNGTPQESEEMNPQWFTIDNIPWEHMWDSDQLWIPHILNNKRVAADFVFDDREKVIDMSVIAKPLTV